jgi:RsiW-degrading membrane proteinase PrsW (M82 family)
MEMASPVAIVLPRRPRLYQYPLAVVLALAGGVLGIIGAAFQESFAFSPLPFLIAAPIIEEIAKPAGVYLAMARWPQTVRNPLFIACLAALGGIVFGLIESLIYVTVYAPDLGRSFFIYRFAVNVPLHGGFSFIAGLGITQGLFAWAGGRSPFPKQSRNAFAAAMMLHALYNLVAVVLSASGVLEFE